MAQIRGMMACSLDGFAADAEGSVDWLAPFESVDWGYADFIAQVATVVMGRRTYAHTLTLAPEWPYPGKRGIVLGGVQGPFPEDVGRWTGDLAALIAHLRALTDGDVWVVGGPSLQATLLRAGALDRLELCIVPCLIGQGLRVFPEGVQPTRQPQLSGIRDLPMGMVMLDYRF